jgi:hypothetical protein
MIGVAPHNWTVEGCRQCVVDDLFAAAADDRVLPTDIKAILALEFGSHCLAQRAHAGDLCIARMSRTNRVDCRVADVHGRVEVRLAGTQRDDAGTRGTARCNAVHHAVGRRRFDLGEVNVQMPCVVCRQSQ